MDATTTTHIANLYEALEHNGRTIAGYRKMLNIAENHGMAYEVERITDSLDEYEADSDLLRSRLLELGYDPIDEQPRRQRRRPTQYATRFGAARHD